MLILELQVWVHNFKWIGTTCQMEACSWWIFCVPKFQWIECPECDQLFFVDHKYARHAYEEHYYSFDCHHCHNHFPGDDLMFCIHMKMCLSPCDGNPRCSCKHLTWIIVQHLLVSGFDCAQALPTCSVPSVVVWAHDSVLALQAWVISTGWHCALPKTFAWHRL